jgi:hypothetical protein
MNYKSPFIILITAVLFLSGCANDASFSEKMKDNFLFTSADKVQTQVKCIRLTKPYVLKSGLATYTFPSGIYKGTKQNDSGVFYYSSSPVKSSLGLLGSGSVDGIFLHNDLRSGNFFGHSYQGYSDRPIRSVQLPRDIFGSIQTNVNCR